jgi:hypothetical protein
VREAPGSRCIRLSWRSFRSVAASCCLSRVMSLVHPSTSNNRLATGANVGDTGHLLCSPSAAHCSTAGPGVKELVQVVLWSVPLNFISRMRASQRMDLFQCAPWS